MRDLLFHKSSELNIQLCCKQQIIRFASYSSFRHSYEYSSRKLTISYNRSFK